MSRNSYFSVLPPATKYLLLVNVVVLLIDYVFRSMHIQLSMIFGMFNFGSPYLHFWQPFTYMFMHADFWHLFCNMFAVFMFAPALEHRWGTKRFLIYYLVCGVGAGLVQQLVWYLMGTTGLTVGASGAVFGVLFAFGWLFPEVELFLMFIPIPIRARIFVILYALLELWQGVAHTAGDNVAHFAHLGGMLFGWLLILYWNRRGYTGAAKAEFKTDFTERIKDWWNNLKSHFSSKKKKGRFDGYHYKDPISNTASENSDNAQGYMGNNEKTDNDELNRILDKVKLHGYSSLTDEEKAKLFRRN